MLTLILGRAKSGKTAKIMNELRMQVLAKRPGNVLLVPEQYSHEAEMELLRVCGDSMSLYAEVLSFTRLAARVEGELGRREGTLLDKGGRLLCMALALDAVGSRLKLYGGARRQTELQESLLATLDGFKAACISAAQLSACAEGRSDILGDKLRDLALVYEAYEAVAAQGRLDPVNRLTYLAETIGCSTLGRGRFYLDGFTDFTIQERGVVEALLRAGADVTVCLTCEGPEESYEIFESSRRAALALERLARECSVSCQMELIEGSTAADPMAVLERELFGFGSTQYESEGQVTLRKADSVGAECEAAAAYCLALVQGGCRWRDIAISVRGYEDYRSVLEQVFVRYGIPLYSAGKSGVAAKPLYTLISAAFEILSGGWEHEAIFSYLKTGLAGLNQTECDLLENYTFLWSLRGSAWTKNEDWNLHPDGYNGEYTDETWQTLRQINALRRRVAQPLLTLAVAGREAVTAGEQARALAQFFRDLGLAETLQTRAETLRCCGMEKAAAEYVQLWDIVVSALEQCDGILGGVEMEQSAFGKLYCLVLSKYEVGTIPLTLDRVSAGDMDRMRRRSIRHLLVLGCDSTRVPMVQSGGGIFSEDDLECLAQAGLDLGDSASDRLYHEFALIYNCITLPAESLYVSYCVAGDEGAVQPAFLFSRLEQIFRVQAEPVDADACRRSAPGPALELAARDLRDNSSGQSAALRYFTERGEGEHLAQLRSAAALGRGQLSRQAVQLLYGEKLRLSASRIDKFASCRFSYFLQYGLKAKPRQAASFSPPEMGTFMHYILENVAGDLSARGGFADVDGAEIDALCDKYVAQYVHEKLNDFREKSPRFVYLFRRLTGSVRRVVRDMAAELAVSDFKPLDFELNFGEADMFPPIELGDAGESMQLTGIADRVDGFVHDGKLYVRVVDYKTGWKQFSLTDVWYGMGLQMLLYLFALEREGKARYGMEIAPAGVLYIPARDKLLSADARLSEEELLEKKEKSTRRSGLLLDDSAILQAMERGEAPRYLPVKIKNGEYSGDSLASAERLGLLGRHIEETLRALAAELHSGSIAADPYFRSQTDTACMFCDYRAACHFDEERDQRRYLTKLKNGQVWEKLEQGGEN